MKHNIYTCIIFYCQISSYSISGTYLYYNIQYTIRGNLFCTLYNIILHNIILHHIILYYLFFLLPTLLHYTLLLHYEYSFDAFKVKSAITQSIRFRVATADFSESLGCYSTLGTYDIYHMSHPLI